MNCKTKKRKICFVLIFIILISLMLQFPISVSAINNYDEFIQKTQKLTEYANKYNNVENPTKLVNSYIVAGEYKSGMWDISLDSNFKKEVDKDKDNLSSLQESQNVKLSNGEIVNLNSACAVLLRENLLGGYVGFILNYLDEAEYPLENNQQLNYGKSVINNNLSEWLGLIDGENLKVLFNSNTSQTLPELLNNYYKDISMEKRIQLFVKNNFGNIAFTKDNLRNTLYNVLVSDKDVMKEINGYFDEDEPEYEIFLKNITYGFADWFFDIYPDIPPNKLDFSASRKALEVNTDYILDFEIQPNTVKNRTITLESSDSSIVSIIEGTKIHTNKTGIVTLKATCGNISVEKEFKIFDKIENIKLSQESLTIPTHKSVTLKVLIDTKETEHNITWDSKDKTIATVNDSGSISGVSLGETIITATTDTGAFAECKVLVTQPLTNVSFDDYKKYMEVGESYQTLIKYSPVNIESPQYVFSSSNEKIATIDETGLVTALKSGKTKIRVASASDSSVMSQVDIEISPKITDIECPDEQYIFLDKTMPLDINVLPKEASSKTLIYESNNEIVTCNNDGTVTGNELGTAKVSITPKDNTTLSKTITVHVVIGVEKIDLNVKEISIKKDETFSLVVNMLPSNANNKEYKVEVEDSSVISINGINHVTGLKKGTSKILITASDESGTQALCIVHVKGFPIVPLIIFIILIILLISGTIFITLNKSKIQAYIKSTKKKDDTDNYIL